MNCTTHPEMIAVTNCEACQKPFCQPCLVKMGDRTYCHSCSRQKADARSLTGAEGNPSPSAAFWLGLIPGVGAIYNGEYFKAFVNVMIFGFLISLGNNAGIEGFDTLFHLMTAAFFFYMPLEAYHTAKRRVLEARGIPVEPVRSEASQGLWAGIALTVMGLLLFVDRLHPGFLGAALRFWPLGLVGFGSYKIWEHFQRRESSEAGT
jgi:hypothetical protein